MPDERSSAHRIDQIFLDRQSPRSFTGGPVPLDDLMTMFEAARWAPSSRNVQPWRFVYALPGTPYWGPMFETLMPMNQRWADKAGALVVFLSDLHMTLEDKSIVSPWHSFDTGAAWMCFALQAHSLGYATHGMGGFFNDKVRATLHVPDDFGVDMVAAVGTRGPADALPDDLRAREVATPRRALEQSVHEGSFGAG